MKFKKDDRVMLRVDDVLLTDDGLTGSMKNSLRYGNFFDNFKKMDAMFLEYGAPCTLAILADGIEKNPEWVDYIKKNQHRYQIEMHGYSHFNYKNVTEEAGYVLLKQAKEMIEDTFKVQVTRWFVPFSRLGFPEWGARVSARLGVGFHHKLHPGYILHFHYWNSRDHRRLARYLPLFYAKQYPAPARVVA